MCGYNEGLRLYPELFSVHAATTIEHTATEGVITFKMFLCTIQQRCVEYDIQ